MRLKGVIGCTVATTINHNLSPNHECLLMCISTVSVPINPIRYISVSNATTVKTSGGGEGMAVIHAHDVNICSLRTVQTHDLYFSPLCIIDLEFPPWCELDITTYFGVQSQRSKNSIRNLPWSPHIAKTSNSVWLLSMIRCLFPTPDPSVTGGLIEKIINNAEPS